MSIFLNIKLICLAYFVYESQIESLGISSMAKLSPSKDSYLNELIALLSKLVFSLFLTLFSQFNILLQSPDKKYLDCYSDCLVSLC